MLKFTPSPPMLFLCGALTFDVAVPSSRPGLRLSERKPVSGPEYSMLKFASGFPCYWIFADWDPNPVLSLNSRLWSGASMPLVAFKNALCVNFHVPSWRFPTFLFEASCHSLKVNSTSTSFPETHENCVTRSRPSGRGVFCV